MGSLFNRAMQLSLPLLFALFHPTDSRAQQRNASESETSAFIRESIGNLSPLGRINIMSSVDGRSSEGQYRTRIAVSYKKPLLIIQNTYRTFDNDEGSVSYGNTKYEMIVNMDLRHSYSISTGRHPDSDNYYLLFGCSTQCVRFDKYRDGVLDSSTLHTSTGIHWILLRAENRPVQQVINAIMHLKSFQPAIQKHVFD